MNNYNSEWRVWAKVVAVIDLIVVLLQLLGTLLMTFMVTTVAVTKNPENEKIQQEAEVVAFVLWIAVAIMVVLTCVGLWAAVQLLKATELGREAKDAYQCCHSWQIVGFVFIVGSIISGCMLGTYTSLIIGALVRIVFLFIVYLYMQELHQAKNDLPAHDLITDLTISCSIDENKLT